MPQFSTSDHRGGGTNGVQSILALQWPSKDPGAPCVFDQVYSLPLLFCWLLRNPQRRRMVSGSQDPHWAKLLRSQSAVCSANCVIFINGTRSHTDIYHPGLGFVPLLLGIKMRTDRNPMGAWTVQQHSIFFPEDLKAALDSSTFD